MSEAVHPQPARRSVADLVLLVLGGAMILGALVLLLRGGPEDGGAGSGPVPGLGIVQPAPGAAVSGPFGVVFRSEQELRQMPTGWGADSLHLHILIDGQSYMPSPTDIQRQPDGSYRWSVPALPPGEHSLRLFWSGPDHRPIPRGGSERVQVRAQ